MLKLSLPTQLPLTLTSPVLYSETNFFVHSGVKESYAACRKVLNEKQFSFLLIQGDHRFGKTHFLLKLFSDATQSGVYPKLIDDKDFIQEELNTEGDVYLIDNFDALYHKHFLCNPGAFVSFYETCKKNGRSIIAALTSPIEANEPHTGSRIKSAQYFSLKNPEEDDLSSLCAAMAAQRGIHLRGRKLSFTSRRIRRDIPSIEKYLERLVHISHRLGKSVEFSRLKGAL